MIAGCRVVVFVVVLLRHGSTTLRDRTPWLKKGLVAVVRASGVRIGAHVGQDLVVDGRSSPKFRNHRSLSLVGERAQVRTYYPPLSLLSLQEGTDRCSRPCHYLIHVGAPEDGKLGLESGAASLSRTSATAIYGTS